MLLQNWLLPPMSKALRCTLNYNRYSSTLAAPFDLQDHIPSSSTHLHSTERQEKIQALRSSLNRSKDPENVWTHYVGLINLFGREHLDLSLHQEVLRKCTLPSHSLRHISNRRLRQNQDPLNILNESRFQTIIRNIRASRMTPSIDDYHFILEQFAAVGHHVGAMNVYHELIQGADPQQKTFGLCLQAIAHRLSITVSPLKRPQVLVQARTMMSELMDSMQKYSVPFSSINLDFIIRILKETSDLAGFESLLKLGYGIDMSYPDRPALELFGTSSVFAGASVPAEPLYFSVSALNAVVDMYGSKGHISRMVQAFEVLTVPLPQAQQHFFSSFEDDDDFGVASKSSVPSFAPSAQPNSKTMKLMLKHLAKANHFQLMRHYILVAIELDRAVDRQTRINLVTLRDQNQVPSPHFAVDKAMLGACFTSSKRRKRLAFLRWLEKKLHGIIKKKRMDLEFYENYRKGLSNKKKLAPIIADSISSDSSRSSVFTAPSLENPVNHVWAHFRGQRWRLFNIDGEVNADANDQHRPDKSGPPPMKPFNINLHLRLLEENVEGLEWLKQRLERSKALTHERIKDRLGRRVWKRKDIYLLIGGDRRGRVSKQRWRGIVNYKPKPVAPQSTESTGI